MPKWLHLLYVQRPMNMAQDLEVDAIIRSPKLEN